MSVIATVLDADVVRDHCETAANVRLTVETSTVNGSLVVSGYPSDIHRAMSCLCVHVLRAGYRLSAEDFLHEEGGSGRIRLIFSPDLSAVYRDRCGGLPGIHVRPTAMNEGASFEVVKMGTSSINRMPAWVRVSWGETPEVAWWKALQQLDMP